MLAACWTSQQAMPDEPKPVSATVEPATTERRGTLRLDENPKASRFYGVWFEHADGSRWIVDYRARALWTWFIDREVVATGECYEPQGHAIRGTHYRVATLRPAVAESGKGPYLAIGPETLMHGEITSVAAPAGSKAAGSSRTVFKADGGGDYTVVGETEPKHGRVSVRARVLEPDMSYVARSDGPDLWIDEDDGTAAFGVPPAVPCP